MPVGFESYQAQSLAHRSSRSASPDMKVKQLIHQSSSDAMLTSLEPVDHKRSSSDPAMLSQNGGLRPSNHKADVCGTASVASSRSSMPNLPVNVNPKNLVMKFDARKDNLSFSAIDESDEGGASAGSYLSFLG